MLVPSCRAPSLVPLFSFRTVLGKNGPKPKRLLRSRISLSLCLSIVPLQGPPFSHVCLYRNGQGTRRLAALAGLLSSDLEASSRRGGPRGHLDSVAPEYNGKKEYCR